MISRFSRISGDLYHTWWNRWFIVGNSDLMMWSGYVGVLGGYTGDIGHHIMGYDYSTMWPGNLLDGSLNPTTPTKKIFFVYQMPGHATSIHGGQSASRTTNMIYSIYQILESSFRLLAGSSLINPVPTHQNRRLVHRVQSQVPKLL